MSELLTRISERTDAESKKFIKEFKADRWKIVEDTIKDKKSLIKWLYEEQGERRFDAANRLFLVLIDKENMEDSWKMKRNIELLGDEVNPKTPKPQNPKTNPKTPCYESCNEAKIKEPGQAIKKRY